MALSAGCNRRIVLLLAGASLACAPAPREGETVHIAEESAIIIWDAATKTQHFIRRASFETKAKDFGFLVPTPTVPKFEEADDEAFEHLKRITAPEVRQLSPEMKAEAPKAAMKAPQIVVVATAKVAGYDAAVLEATDAGALNRWLKEHGYASSPDLEDWFRPYIEKKWLISAFKIASDAPGGDKLETKAVHMSFQTEKPFFPYREPESQRKESGDRKARMLRIFFLGEARFDGTVGVAGAWPGSVAWSNSIVGDRDRLMDLVKLPRYDASAATLLTEFEDRSSPRPGTDDLFFRVAPDQSNMQRPVTYVSQQGMQYSKELADLFWIVVTVGGIGLFIWMAKRRKDS